MAEYKRYQKLQKYYLGVPVEPAEYKEGELIGIEDYNNIEECEQGIMWKLASSYYCFPLKTVEVEGEYFCEKQEGETYTRYKKLQLYYEDRDVPYSPTTYVKGDVIATGCTSGECNGDARIEQTTEHLCNNWEEYDLVTTKTSYDCGKTWETSTVKENLTFNVSCSDYTYDTNEYEYAKYNTEASGLYTRVHMFTHSDGDIYALIQDDSGYQPSSGNYRYIHTYYLYRYHKSTSSWSLVKDFNTYSTTENMWSVNGEYYKKNSYFRPYYDGNVIYCLVDDRRLMKWDLNANTCTWVELNYKTNLGGTWGIDGTTMCYGFKDYFYKVYSISGATGNGGAFVYKFDWDGNELGFRQLNVTSGTYRPYFNEKNMTFVTATTPPRVYPIDELMTSEGTVYDLHDSYNGLPINYNQYSVLPNCTGVYNDYLSESDHKLIVPATWMMNDGIVRTIPFKYSVSGTTETLYNNMNGVWYVFDNRRIKALIGANRVSFSVENIKSN